jgi:hypothetical protein
MKGVKFISWLEIGSSFISSVSEFGEPAVIETISRTQLPKGLHSAIFLQAPVAPAIPDYKIGSMLLF